jgi:hypothetical protein
MTIKLDYLFNREFPLPRFMAAWAGLLCRCIYPNVMIGVSGLIVGFLRRNLRRNAKHPVASFAFSCRFLNGIVFPEQEFSDRSHRH